MRIWARLNGREQKITLVRKLRHLGYPSWFAELMTNQATTKLSSIISMHAVSSQVAVADSAQVIGNVRSEERRVGKECVSTCRSRRSTYHETKNKIEDKHKRLRYYKHIH